MDITPDRTSLDFFSKGGYRDARDEFILSNGPMVRHIARKFRGRGVSKEDLIQEGNLGLIRAVDSFDISRDTDFDYYAWVKIHEAMQKAVARNWGVRVPKNTLMLMFKWNDAVREFRKEHDRMPTDREVADRLKIGSSKQIQAVHHALRVHRSMSRRTKVESLARRDAADDGDVVDTLSHLDERTQNVLRLRYGIGTGEGKSLKEVGNEMGCSHENARKIEMRGIDELRKLFL